MRHALVGVLVVIGSGCFNPDDIFPVKGTVVSGSPVEGQVVRLLRQSQQGDFGSCDAEGAPVLKQTTADAEGRYGFEVFRAQAQNLTSFGPYCFRVDADFPSGSAAWSDLNIFSETQAPALRDWRARPRFDGGVLDYEPALPAGWLDAGALLDHRAQVLTDDGGLLWQVDDRFVSLDGGDATVEPMVLDAVRLEDFSGTVTLVARIYEPSAGDGSLFGGGGATWPSNLRAGEHLAVSGRRAPVSRGLPCPDVATPCPLTDGDLSVVEVDLREGVTLELPVPVPLSAIVLRGVETGVPFLAVLLTQADGGLVAPVQHLLPVSMFEALSPTSGRPSRPGRRDGGVEAPSAGGLAYSVIPLDAGVPIRRVTLRFPGGLSRVAEISLVE